MILSVPEYGWTDLCLGKTKYGLGYLTCVPINWMDAAIYGLETLEPFVVGGLCEPGILSCLVTFRHCYIILSGEDEKPARPEETPCECICVKIGMLDFCKELYSDISNNLDAWSHWEFSCAETEEEERRAVQAFRKLLEERLRRMEPLIKRREAEFSKGRFYVENGEVKYY